MRNQGRFLSFWFVQLEEPLLHLLRGESRKGKGLELKNKGVLNKQNRNRFIDTQNRLMVATWEDWGTELKR